MRTDGHPTIVSFETSERFGHLWLKYVTGYDLTQHCARCLLGTYSRRVTAGATSIHQTPLDEARADCYYLCGVTRPYRWRDNLHVAFRHKEGATLHYSDGRTTLVIRDAERIPIERRADYRPLRGQWETAYTTCRNWMFAVQMSTNQDLL